MVMFTDLDLLEHPGTYRVLPEPVPLTFEEVHEVAAGVMEGEGGCILLPKDYKDFKDLSNILNKFPK